MESTTKYNSPLFQGMVHEKETHLNSLMQIMGLNGQIINHTWQIQGVIHSLLITTIIVLLLKIPFHNAVAVFHHTSASQLITAFFIFSLAMPLFAVITSGLFSTSKRAMMFISLIYILSMGPALLTRDILKFGQSPWDYLAYVFPTSWLVVTIKRFIYAEDAGLTNVENPMVFHGTFMLLFWIILEMYFIPLMRMCFCGCCKRSVSDETYNQLLNTSTRDDEDEEEHGSSISSPRFKMENLTKVFDGNFVAVNDVTLVLNTNEITVLLGENGAGKSTLMGMLTGVEEPTGGTAEYVKGGLFDNLDIVKDLPQVRNRIGYCPQENVLFDQLTVWEHLMFYGQVKCVDRDFLTRSAEELLMDFALFDHKNEMSSKLSGGMKRKLNLAIALVGGTKAVFLDEPTSGVDPASRREIWRCLQKYKEGSGRCMLISTHFMDEADVLGDRVAILHGGVLKCKGTAMQLKEKYKSSYKLVSGG